MQLSLDNKVPSDPEQKAVIEGGARKLAMHVVAASPLFLQAGDAPEDLVEREKAIFKYVYLLLQLG